MPWMINPGGPSPWGQNQTKHLPKPRYTEWEERMNVWAEARRAARKVDGEDVYLQELCRAEPIQNLDHLPQTIRWTKRGKLKDCVAFLGHLVLSGRARDMIEALEPGVHDFYEIAMENVKTGEIWPEPFWLLHIRNNIDSIDEERTGSQRSEFFFREEAIRDVHLWRDSRFYLRSRTFASDHFVAELERRGIEGIGADRYCSIVKGGVIR